METKQEKSFFANIYLAGDVNIIKQACRQFCLEIGFCVTITETLFIYTGGEEFGVQIGCINYPRFPKTNDEVLKRAKELAEKCRTAACQQSYLIMTPEITIYDSNRDYENKK